MQLFVFRTRTRPANMHIIFRVEWTWMMHVTTVLQIINNPSAANTKDETKETQEGGKKKGPAWSRRTQWKNTALAQLRFLSVVSETDQCDQRDSEENDKSPFHRWIRNCSNWQPWIIKKKKSTSFVNDVTGVKEKHLNLQSLPLVGDMMQNWTQALAIYTQHPLSWCL